MMDRNLDRRVEALVRVDDRALQERLDGILDLAWADTVRRLGRWAATEPGRAFRQPTGR